MPSNVDKHSTDGEVRVRLCNYVDVYYNDHITNDLELMNATASLEEERKFGLRAGDVIITKDSESWEDIAVSAYVPASLDGVLCGYHLAIVRPDQDVVDGAYLFRAFSAPGINSQFRVAANGITRFALGQDAIGTALFPLPPREEQCAIAAFLDRETARIDGLIAKKERLLELLDEKRTALITRAVTKGLDPAVPMKESGVEWLGKMPASWAVKPLKRVASLDAGTGITADNIEDVGDFPVYGGNGIRGFATSYTHEGDLPLIGRQGALCGCVNFATGKFWASEHAVVATPLSDVDPHWLAYLLRAMSLNRYSESAAQPGLAVDTISALYVPTPQLAEQREIRLFLDQESVRIEALMTKVRAAITLLREYRTALISAAVTGQIDVTREPSQGPFAPRAPGGERDQNPQSL